MKVYVLEVFWGCDWEVVAVYKTEEAAYQEGESVLAHSADYVEYIVTGFGVKD